MKLSGHLLSFLALLVLSCTITLSDCHQIPRRGDEPSRVRWKTTEEYGGMEWPKEWQQFKDWATGRKTGTRYEGSGKRQLTAADANCTIALAGSLSLTPTTNNFWSTVSRSLVDGYTLWQEWSDTMPPVLVDGNLCNFTVQWYDDGTNQTAAVELYNQLMADPNVDLLLGPVTGAMSIRVRTETERQERMLVGTAVGNTEFYYNQPNTYMVSTPDKYNFPAILQLLALQGAKTVAYVKEAKAAFFDAACDSVYDAGLDAGLTLLREGKFVVYSANDAAVAGYAQNISSTVDGLASVNADVVIWCGNPGTVLALLQSMREKNYFPKAISGATYDPSLFETLPAELIRYFGGVSQWTSLANKPGDPFFGTPAEYAATFEARFGYPAGLYNAVGTIVPLLLQLAVERAGTRDREAIQEAFELTNLETFWGRVAFDAQGGCTIRDMDGIQYGRENELLMVAPSRYARAAVIYPAPGWDDRTYDPQYFDHDSEVAIAILSGVLIISSLALMVFTVVFWKHVVIAAASPLFLLFFLAGSIVAYASVFMWMLHTNGTMCVLTFWFLGIGFTIMFGSLFAKTWRIQKIIGEAKKIREGDKSFTTKVLIFLRIKNPNAKKKGGNRFKKSEVITWKRLAVILGIIVGIEALILGLYTLIAPFFDLTTKVVKSEYYETENYTVCERNAVFITFAVLLAAYNLGLMLYGVILSWMLRNVQWTLFNESKAIAFAMYNIFFFSVLIGALEFSGAVSRETMFILRSLGIFAAAAISVAVIFAPKIYLICRGVQTLDGSTSHSKDSKLSLTDDDEIKAAEERARRVLDAAPGDDAQALMLKAMLRQVHAKMQDGTIGLAKWEDLEASSGIQGDDDDNISSSSSSSASTPSPRSEPGHDAGIP